jgi:AraC-like DNA-binding protein
MGVAGQILQHIFGATEGWFAVNDPVFSKALMDGVGATSVAYEVGYESVSQFNREYSRFFGQPPMRDIKALRATSTVAA